MDHRAKNMDLAGRKSFGQKVATASYYDCYNGGGGRRGFSRLRTGCDGQILIISEIVGFG